MLATNYCGNIKSITKQKRHVSIMESFRTNCKMESWLRYGDNVNENASVLSPLPTED